MGAASIVLFTMGLLSWLYPARAAAANELQNGSFEEGVFAVTSSPDGWSHSAWQPSAEFIWDDSVVLLHQKSVRITHDVDNDSAWVQTIQLEPETHYLLSGWIRTQDVSHTSSGADPGANLSLWGTWIRSTGVYGTSDWTYVSMVIASGLTGEVTIGARIGSWGGATTGSAWFDDIQVTRIDASAPHPRWSILVLIYGSTDFQYVDGDGLTHHVVAAMTDEERTFAAQRATRFVKEDIPALDSGNMIPTLEVRFPAGPLNRLSPIGDRWWPSPGDTAVDLDPGFDSIIVIWDPRGQDLTTGQPIDLNGAGGLAPNRGRDQTYLTIIAQGAVSYPHRNVFKHEWGHSILGFFEAMEASPLPTVTNHATPGQYVHWPTGEDYVWLDETLDNPIPNSIYSNESGFTHDYYSGTTATPDQPTRRLGITPYAWALGGPITQPIRPTDCGDPDDVDCDGLGNAADLCPFFSSPDQTDTDSNGIGDLCECGDQTGDGFVNIADILEINDVIFELAEAGLLCDTNDDDQCNISDILGVNAKIFGAEAHCARYPGP